MTAATDEWWQHAGRTSRYGRSALRDEARMLRWELAHQRDRHVAMRTTALRVAGLVLGGEVNADEGHAVLSCAVFDTNPDRMSEWNRLWDWALNQATPRSAKTTGIADKFSEPNERRMMATQWLDHVCSDDAIVAGGVKGANALAICTHFAAVSARIGSTVLSESYRQLGLWLCMGPMTAFNCEHLWGRHVKRETTGRRRRPTDVGEASTWRLRFDSFCYSGSQTGESFRYSPKGMSRPLQGRIRMTHGLSLTDPLHLPWHDRWVIRDGGRLPWRIWLELETDDSLTISEVAERVAAGRKAVGRHLRQMEAAGEVQDTGDGFVRGLGHSHYDNGLHHGNQVPDSCSPISTRADAPRRHLNPVSKSTKENAT